MVAEPVYEVFAVRYATRAAMRSEHFIGGDPHDGPMPMDYFLWLVRGAGRTIVVDAGFTAEVAARRKRTLYGTRSTRWRYWACRPPTSRTSS